MSGGEIDDFLDELGQGAKPESWGRFTISPEKLREKLARFQFERPAQWILKVIQALVSGGASKIAIRQSRERIKISFFCPVPPWSPDELAGAFWEPSIPENAPLNDLLQALYFLSFRLEVGWCLATPETSTALQWSGTELAEIASEPQIEHSLVVNLEGFGTEGDWLSSLGLQNFSKGPKWAAEVSAELFRHAYVCPVPLFLDGIRIDNLFLCSSLTQPRKFSGPHHGPVSETVHVVSLGWGSESDFGLKLPMATFKQPREDKFARARVPEFSYLQAKWICLLTAHLKGPAELTGFVYTPWEKTSLVTWIRHGVVIGQTSLRIQSALSCQIFLSADSFTVDLTGLKLQPNEASSDFANTCLGEAGQWLSCQTIELDILKSQEKGFVKVVEGGLLAAGSSLMLCGALVEGLFVGAMAVPLWLLSTRAQPSLQLERDLQTQLSHLCTKWSSQVRPG